MDSGNSSGSLQSSSGGDEEYDSRAESSFSASFMLNNNNHHSHVGLGLAPFTTTATANSFGNSHTLPPPQHHHRNNNTHVLFDPLSNYLDPMQQRPPISISPSLSSIPNPNSALLNLDMMWSSSKPSRSEQNPTDLGSLVPGSDSSSPLTPSQLQQQGHALLSSGGHVQGQTTRDNSGVAFHALPADSHQHEGGSRGLRSVSAANNNSNNNDHQPHNTNSRNVGVRNPKKRSRASRRAPTTVLTTDTTNFRAMVQEFTGIPAQPFTSSSPFQRTRFDLFGSAPNLTPSSSTVRSTLLDPSSLVPPYLLRPFAQKAQHHLHPFPSNSMVESLLASNNNSTNYSTSVTDHLGLLKQHPLNFNNNNNNPILSFQQQSPKYPLGNSNPSSSSSIVASKTQPSLGIPPPSSSGDSFLKVGVFEELGGLSTDGGLHQNMVSSCGNSNNNLGNASTTEWAQRTTGTITNDDREQGRGDGLAGGTVNYSSNVTERTARSEGMVESWINCSSDN